MEGQKALSKEISKLISAIHREWLEELGSANVSETTRILKGLRNLLEPKQDLRPAFDALQASMSKCWLEDHPWVIPHVQKIATLLECPRNADSSPL